MNDKFKIKDFIRLIKNIEKLYVNNLGNNTSLLEFLQKFRTLLHVFKGFSGDDFLALFESLKAGQMITKEKGAILGNINIEEISFVELRRLLESNSLLKEELLEIGEKRFSISKGTNKRLNKEQLEELIESAMMNIETLNVIKSKAAE